MSDEHADFLNGLHVVECELERVIGELDEMQDRRDIPTLDRVSLDPLQWALNKLADDLHDASAEIRNARQKHLDEHLQWASFFNGLRAELETVKAERDSLQRQWDDLEKSFVQSMQPTMASAVQLVEAAKATAVQVTKKTGELPDETAPESDDWQVGDEVESDGESPRLVITRDAKGWVFFKESAFGLPQFEWERLGWKLYRKASDVPPAPAPEPYQWQVGDEIECNGVTRRKVIDRREGWVFLEGVTSPLSQPDWERRGWKLYRKASDVPFIEQQVAEFAAVTEPIDDSVGTDGEGQS
jgi:hypothetical protein